MSNQRMQECIENCLQCHRLCLEMAMNHCLEKGGEHVAPTHLRLMMNCAQICQTAADFMLSASPLHAQTCAVCANVCEACADSCEPLEGMEDCIRACRICAESCREMAGDFHLLGTQQVTEQAAARPLG